MGDRVGERRRYRARVDLPLDEVADEPRFRHIADDDVVPVRILADLRRRRPGFLVIVFAVNERRDPAARIALDTFPHVEHGAAGRIDEHAADRPQRVEIGDRHPERRKDHGVFGPNAAEVEGSGRGGAAKDLDAHLFEPGVYVRIVDDLANKDNATIRKLAPSLVGVLDRALYAITEAEFPRQFDRYVADREPVVAATQQVDNVAVIIRGELVLDFGLEPETLSEISGWLGRRRHGCESSP